MVQKQAMISRFADGANEASGDAGHAVAAVVLRLKIGRRGVTIVPEKQRDILGYTNVAAKLRVRPDCAWAVAHLAGDVAERKFSGKRPSGRHSHVLHASDLLEHISSSVEWCRW